MVTTTTTGTTTAYSFSYPTTCSHLLPCGVCDILKQICPRNNFSNFEPIPYYPYDPWNPVRYEVTCGEEKNECPN